MSLSFRPYEDTDLDLLQSCIMAWRNINPDGTYCHAGDIAHRLYNGNRGYMALSDITRIYMQDDKVVVLLLCYPRHEFFDVFVHPDFESEHDLIEPIINEGYQIVHDYLAAQGKANAAIFVECFPNDTSRQELLIKSGFVEHTNDMNRTQRSLEYLPEIHLPTGFTIRTVTLDDAEQLATVHNRSFTSSWTSDIYRNEVMLKPGYTPEREFVVIDPDGTFAGFCVTWLDTVNKVGLFEPVGTHENYRQMGLGTALMTHAMQVMKTEGMIHAEVCYGIKNLPAKKLYTKLGFEPKHRIFDWKCIADTSQS